ncbi:hypothetical protein Tco_1568147 [Tanacetum coccineum]
MSTPVYVDPESSIQADGAQSSRVPVTLPEDPYEAIRQTYLVGTNTESKPFEGEAKASESPHTVASPTLLPDSTPPAYRAEESKGSNTSSVRSTSSDSTAPLLPDHPLTHTTPTLVPILRRTAPMAVRVPPEMSSGLSVSMAGVAAMFESIFRKRFRSSYESSPSLSLPDLPSRKHYRGTFELVEDSEEDDDEEDEESMDSNSVSKDAEDEGLTAKDDDPAARDEGLAARVEVPSMDDESRGSDDGIHGLDEEGHSVESDRLGLGYGELRHQGLALEENHVYSTFEVGQGSGSAPEPERLERVSAFRQPTLTTWTDLEDAMVYIDLLVYPAPTPPVQSSPLHEWSFSLFPISPSPSVVPSPISSPMIPLTVPYPVATPATAETKGFLTELGALVEMQGGLIRDHAVQLEDLSPALFERFNRDIRELYTRSWAVRDKIFSQRHRFKSLEYEQERVAVTFGAIWRPVLAMESWTGQTDAQRAALWHAIGDMHGENWDLRLQLAEERRARLELAEVVDSVRSGQEPRGHA